MKPLKFIGGVLLICTLLTGISFVTGWLGEAKQVASKELGPKAALQKYEWFKDASNELVRKKVDIELYQTRTDSVCNVDPMASNCSLFTEQLFGLKSSYNALVAEYNSASSKFNWSMFNTEGLPTTYQEF